MRLTKINQVRDFLDVVNHCQGSVWLVSACGDTFNLKSGLSQYIAIGALLSENGDMLELKCSLPEDEALFFEFFTTNPEVVES